MKKRMKKTAMFILSLILMFSLVGCQKSGDASIEEVNDFLNTSAGLGPGTIGNAVQIVPHAHIDGPKNETPFYAFVGFKYKSRDFIKYQVTYLSCTCRPAPVNVWQTMYVELTLPSSKDPKDAEVKFISFDKESTGDYRGGVWGDSDPMPGGQTYELFKEEYIPYFVDKNSEFLHTLSTMDDIDVAEYKAGEGRSAYEIDTIAGASVSANNIIRILHSVLDYHATDEFFTN